ncbi:sensor histidine kinase [Methylococcus geothermalis]|uniref:histidine kinase n=1 Tax=Methylococcus geothermalis TaxID=2681310 RepID=A0A858Q8Y3_9GAMM|nr:HAMP domain-containing sensor histidine kinase [Methylococcus geothermalis]QJD30362.1 HAMP domain-containing protein [Methylococcus geothermalis]
MYTFRFPSLSLSKLVLGGFVLAALPLLVAIGSTVSAVDDLAAQSRKTVYSVAQLSQKSFMLMERLSDLERKGKQLLVFDDADMRSAFKAMHEQVQDIVLDLRVRTEDEPLTAQLDQFGSDEAAAYQSVVEAYESRKAKTQGPVQRRSSQGSSAALEKFDGVFQALGMRARALSQAYTVLIDEDVAMLDAHSKTVQDRILVRSAVLVPGAACLVALFTVLITRPIRQLEHAIRQLGSGDYQQPVSVRGPSDLTFLGERLEWLRGRLNALEEAKQQFMRHVSHEVKTPLATIHEGTGLLADEIVGELNPEQKEITQILVSNTQRLERLIAALINFSQANADPAALRREPVDMHALVSEVLDEYQLRLRANELRVDSHLAKIEIEGNREQLRTVVDNLLSNAVKYSPAGGLISIRLCALDHYMELEVGDQGPGIAPEERQQVFEPFFQGSKGRELGIPGTGLGLAIVRECVMSHHGSVELLDAPVGKGTLVRVRIPWCEESAPRLRVRISLPRQGESADV